MAPAPHLLDGLAALVKVVEFELNVSDDLTIEHETGTTQLRKLQGSMLSQPLLAQAELCSADLWV